MAHKFVFSSSAVPSNVAVAGFRGSEALSTPYHFDVYIHVPTDAEIDLADAIGAKASLSILDDQQEIAVYAGVLASIELIRAVKSASLYLARIVPHLWQLSNTRHSRLFTKQKLDVTIDELFAEEGLVDYELRLTDTYETEEHVCQYKESSLDFLHRWLEREGAYYFFEQAEGGETLVIADNASAHAAVATGPVRYHPTTGTGDGSAGRHFDVFTARHLSVPANVKLTDFDYAKPALEMIGSASVSDNGFGELRTYGGRFFTPASGTRLARIRAEELRARAVTFFASGAATGISPGYKFKVEEHPHSSLNQEYLATVVEHFGYVADLASPWGNAIKHFHDDVYHVEVTAIIATTQYRHAESTPWPRVDGYENGVIDGPAASEYAQIDDQGRYLVKFKFDEGTRKDGKASTYVRMSQPHAGGIEGWHFPLRKGTEVIFAFLGGDPDRPVITGAIPNAHTPSPVTSGNHTKNVMQTGGRNRLEIEDLAGEQRITLSTPHANSYLRMGKSNDDHELIAKTDQRGLWRTGHNTDFDIKGHWWIEVNKDKKEHVFKEVEELYKTTKSEKVPNGLVTEEYHSQKTTIAHTYDFTVTEKTTENYVQAHTSNHKDTLTRTITLKHTQNDNAAFEQNTKANHTVNVTEGNYKLDVKAGKYDAHVATTSETIVDGTSFKITAAAAEGTIKFKSGKLETDAEWNELVKGDHFNITLNHTTELLGGMKNEYVLGLKTEGVIGLHSEINVGGKLETFIGIKVGFEIGGEVKFGGLFEDKTYPLKSSKFAARIENWACKACIGATTIMQGLKII